MATPKRVEIQWQFALLKGGECFWTRYGVFPRWCPPTRRTLGLF